MVSSALLVVASAFAQTNTSSGTNDDTLSLISTRRVADLAQFPTPEWVASIPTWLASQKDDGTWDDVNYLSGCDARMSCLTWCGVKWFLVMLWCW